ncbi:MAG: trypsin-like peptidase domain-containing protein [Alphaproteobacteria bacterium]|nr:trypsin-like peptidase domain-containing protein [Alphaproteobacteria bacterium]MCB9692160.1 trypsin-like peptidase domain-containing protein [Alphaproteobacteria bacterium]MCB9695139.1 trypsin-like peptidase domain-containing protein [Alphaproteobacteria bacterium]
MLFLALALAEPSARRTPVVEAVEKATPSVVALEVEAQSTFLFGGPQVSASQGSGVIIDADGVVLTNAHVVEGATRIRAHTLGGKVYEAQPVAIEADLDLAILRLEDATGLVPIEIADSDALLLGETTIAIGNPYGLGLTVSTGVVASRARDMEIQPGVVQTYIQTDAAINPGNSGGALVDLEGRLIGINTAIRAQAQGIGFAIPSNRARKIADDLLHYGSVRAPWLGCDFAEIRDRRLAGTPLERGALQVVAVHSGGPCAKAGMKPGDLAFRVDGRITGNRADLNAWLASRKPGDTVVMEAVRGASSAKYELSTRELPADAGDKALGRLGVTVRVTEGAVVVEKVDPSGTWAAARLRAGDVVLAVDGVRVRTTEELRVRLAAGKARHEPSALFVVQRGRIRGHVEVGI